MTNIPPSPMSPNGILKGDVFSFDYPFINLNEISDSSHSPDWNWKPGTRFVHAPPDDYEAIADGMGKQVLTVIDIHKPGKYPTRVFFTRTWITPRGEAFGKTKLRILSAAAFKILLKGFRHDYRLLAPSPKQRVDA